MQEMTEEWRRRLDGFQLLKVRDQQTLKEQVKDLQAKLQRAEQQFVMLQGVGGGGVKGRQDRLLRVSREKTKRIGKSSTGRRGGSQDEVVPAGVA